MNRQEIEKTINDNDVFNYTEMTATADDYILTINANIERHGEFRTANSNIYY